MFTFPKVLKNGAKVLKLCVDLEANRIVVLCHWESNEATPYVTWECDQKGNAFWGHYFGNIEKAKYDFRERVKI